MIHAYSRLHCISHDESRLDKTRRFTGSRWHHSHSVHLFSNSWLYWETTSPSYCKHRLESAIVYSLEFLREQVDIDQAHRVHYHRCKP